MLKQVQYEKCAVCGFFQQIGILRRKTFMADVSLAQFLRGCLNKEITRGGVE